MKQKWTPHELTTIALLAALLCVSSYIVIPLPFSSASLTAQTLVINLIGLSLAPLQSALVVVVWILIGLVGLPVFSGGMGGPGKLFGPSGGYIFGMLAAVILISLLKGKKVNFKRYFTVTVLAGIPVIYLFGMVVMKLNLGLDWMALFTASVLPFIPLDIVKCAAAAYIAIPLHKVVFKAQGVRV